MTPFSRRVEPERLDSLPATDPAAIRSRGDLRRLNLIMGQPSAVARLLNARRATDGIRRLVDLGGGDGTLLLRVARKLALRSGPVQGVVVDRHALVSDRTRKEFARLGWQLEAATADVLEWLDRPLPPDGTVFLSNLFIHHFEEERLRVLLRRASARSELFVACEPRRSSFTFGASRLVGWIGSNEVTRYDAQVSVRAGFTGREISSLWPAGDGWDLEEGSIGPFSHYFVASRGTHETRAPR